MSKIKHIDIRELYPKTSRLIQLKSSKMENVDDCTFIPVEVITHDIYIKIFDEIDLFIESNQRF